MGVIAEDQVTITLVEDGATGKSAYQSAIEGGLPSTTTESQFNSDLGSVPEIKINASSAINELFGYYATSVNGSSHEALAEANIDNDIFVEKFTIGSDEHQEVETGIKNFLYTNGHWTIDGSVVSLDDYGIDISRSEQGQEFVPVEGDYITIDLFYKEGSSESLANLSDIVANNNDNFMNLIEAIRATIDYNDSWVKTYLGNTGYINIVEDQADPYIEIGKGLTENKLSVKIQSHQISFYQNGVPVAYISNDRLYITNSTIKEQQEIGNFAWVNRNGRLTLKHK